jgi:hypothetical protein
VDASAGVIRRGAHPRDTDPSGRGQYRFGGSVDCPMAEHGWRAGRTVCPRTRRGRNRTWPTPAPAHGLLLVPDQRAARRPRVCPPCAAVMAVGAVSVRGAARSGRGLSFVSAEPVPRAGACPSSSAPVVSRRDLSLGLRRSGTSEARLRMCAGLSLARSGALTATTRWRRLERRRRGPVPARSLPRHLSRRGACHRHRPAG